MASCTILEQTSGAQSATAQVRVVAWGCESCTGFAGLLVADDEPTILELLSGSLRLAGYEVVTAASGVEAVRSACRLGRILSC